MTKHAAKRANGRPRPRKVTAAVGSISLACLICGSPALAADAPADVPSEPAAAVETAQAPETPGQNANAGGPDPAAPAGQASDGAPDALATPQADKPVAAKGQPQEPSAEPVAGDSVRDALDPNGGQKDGASPAPEGAKGEANNGQNSPSPSEPIDDEPGGEDGLGGNQEDPAPDNQADEGQPDTPDAADTSGQGDTPDLDDADDPIDPGVQQPGGEAPGQDEVDPTTDTTPPGGGTPGEDAGGEQGSKAPEDGEPDPEGGQDLDDPDPEGPAPVDPAPPAPQPNVASTALSGDGTALLFTASGDDFAQAWGVAFEVKGPQGTKWHAATKQPDGSWQLSLPASTAGSGTLVANAWANIGSLPSQKLASTGYEAPRPKADIALEWDGDAGMIVVRAMNATCPTGIEFIAVGLTPPAGHAKWYQLALQEDGSWAASVDPEVFKWQPGAYAAELVICDKAWAGVPLDTCRANLSFGTEEIAASVSEDGLELELAGQGGRLRAAWGVAFEIRGAAKTSWVACERQEDGSWSVTVDPANWGGGTITATLYANVGNTNVCMGSTHVRTNSSVAEVACTTQPQSSTVLLSVGGGVIKRATNVAFAVYNTTDGGVPTTWHQAYLQEDGSWSAQIPADSHGVGTCAVKAYATVDGSTSKVASASFTYRCAPTLGGDVYLGGGDYDVTWGMSGLKVLRIHQALGIGDPHYPRYLDGTVVSVRNFQARVGLPATGVVDYDTWMALGLSEDEWYNLGAYASPARVGADASAAERVEAMISRAYDYLGDRYVWDAAGKPGQGVDCSGLVMQGLYAAGVDTGIINPVTHATTTWGDKSAGALYHYGGFNHVSYGERKRGDLIFYGSGAINHVAIYLGNNQVIDAYPYNVRVASVWTPGTVYGVARPFN